MINMRSCYILCVLAAAVRLTESFSPLTAGGVPFARPTTFLVPQQSLLLQRQQVATRSSLLVRLSATDDDDASSESSDAASDNDVSDPGASVPAAPRTTAPMPPKRIDPLLASLTRNNPAPKAPTRTFPILGEVVMDKSSILIVPAVAFGVLGLLTSIYVGINNVDAFTEALKQNAYLQSAPSAPVGEGCRGICSSQEADLDGLRVFMSGLGGGK
jgi:hypothetical protein